MAMLNHQRVLFLFMLAPAVATIIRSSCLMSEMQVSEMLCIFKKTCQRIIIWLFWGGGNGGWGGGGRFSFLK